MMRFKPDFARRIPIPGVKAPVPRPVDIDQAATHFTNLRTLRIYQFESGSIIDGHAEEDEVFIVVLAGRVELTMISDLWQESQSAFTLSAPNESEGAACAAYLPPHAAYKLVPHGDADVAYARATPTSSRPPKIFSSIRRQEAAGITALLDALVYAERLRLRVVQIDATKNPITLTAVDKTEATNEALVHVWNNGAEALSISAVHSTTRIPLASLDTLAIPPGDKAAINVARGSALMLVVNSA